MKIESQYRKIHHGRNFKRLREMLGIKQEAIAIDLGYPTSRFRIGIERNYCRHYS